MNNTTTKKRRKQRPRCSICNKAMVNMDTSNPYMYGCKDPTCPSTARIQVNPHGDILKRVGRMGKTIE